MKTKNTALIVGLISSSMISACWSSETKIRPTNSEVKPTYSSTVSETNKNTTTISKNGEPENTKMTETPTTEIKTGGYTANLPVGFSQPTDAVGQRLLKEYGALFVAKGGAVVPNASIFKTEAEVSSFQAGLTKSKEKIGNFDVELQSAAMKNLKEAIAEAQQSNLKITPRGDDSARRDYAGTVALWASRVNPGLSKYIGSGKLSESEAARIRALSPFEQVPEIFKLESQGMFFSKDFSKSIIFSVAPPGTSQHLSMLALDINENTDAKIRDVLAKHGWFQTVVSDLPHFTFLGVPESQLSGLGLKKVNDGGRVYWLPNL